MRFIDDLVVRTAHSVIRGVFAVGAFLVHVQVVGLLFVGAMIGTVLFAAMIAALKMAILGA